jgi:Fe-Mn family superoxide dismutase
MMTSVSRRQLMIAATGIAAVAASPRIIFTQAAASVPPGPFNLDPLAYPFNALEPHIDTKTMEIHHDRHHQAYVNNLNGFAQEHPQIAAMPIAEVLGHLDDVPETIRIAVRNNLGGHANHTMFWQIMGPNGGKPEGEVLAAIDRDLGGMEKLQSDFNANGLKVFGSGWTFVTVTKDGKLALESRPNQDTPLMDGRHALLGNDVWEHAYYLNYQNRRADYLKAWWNTVNWKGYRKAVRLGKGRNPGRVSHGLSKQGRAAFLPPFEFRYCGQQSDEAIPAIARSRRWIASLRSQ